MSEDELKNEITRLNDESDAVQKQIKSLRQKRREILDPLLFEITRIWEKLPDEIKIRFPQEFKIEISKAELPYCKYAVDYSDALNATYSKWNATITFLQDVLKGDALSLLMQACKEAQLKLEKTRLLCQSMVQIPENLPRSKKEE